jgi:hypothetical protein
MTHEWMDIPDDDDRVRIRSKEAVARGAARTKLLTLHAYNARRSFMTVAFNGLTRRPRENGCVRWGASFWELSDLNKGHTVSVFLPQDSWRMEPLATPPQVSEILVCLN